MPSAASPAASESTRSRNCRKVIVRSPDTTAGTSPNAAALRTIRSYTVNAWAFMSENGTPWPLWMSKVLRGSPEPDGDAERDDDQTNHSDHESDGARVEPRHHAPAAPLVEARMQRDRPEPPPGRERVRRRKRSCKRDVVPESRRDAEDE